MALFHFCQLPVIFHWQNLLFPLKSSESGIFCETDYNTWIWKCKMFRLCCYMCVVVYLSRKSNENYGQKEVAQGFIRNIVVHLKIFWFRTSYYNNGYRISFFSFFFSSSSSHSFTFLFLFLLLLLLPIRIFPFALVLSFFGNGKTCSACVRLM